MSRNFIEHRENWGNVTDTRESTRGVISTVSEVKERTGMQAKHTKISIGILIRRNKKRIRMSGDEKKKAGMTKELNCNT